MACFLFAIFDVLLIEYRIVKLVMLYFQFDFLQLGHLMPRPVTKPAVNSPKSNADFREVCVLIPLLAKLAAVIWPKTKPAIFTDETSSLQFLHSKDILYPLHYCL